MKILDNSLSKEIIVGAPVRPSVSKVCVSDSGHLVPIKTNASKIEDDIKDLIEFTRAYWNDDDLIEATYHLREALDCVKRWANK